MSNSVVQIVYVSRQISAVSESQLREIQRESSSDSSGLDITGVLLYRSGMFFHFIEGPIKETVDFLRKIEAKPYHTDLQVIIVRVAHNRIAEHWSMGVLNLDSIDLDEDPTIPRLIELAETCPPDFDDAEARAIVDQMVGLFQYYDDTPDHKLAG